MEVKSLSFRHFRNLFPGEVEFCGGMNIICGANAQGKTNLAEAIWLFTGAKSFRGAKDSELVAFGAESAELKMDFITGGVLREAAMEIKTRRAAELDGKKLGSAARLAGSFCAIVFSPTDLSLIKDGPSARRRFMDIAIGQLYPAYIDLLRQYSRAVAQRNNIIKNLDFTPDGAQMLDIFENEIVSNGVKIIEYRKKYTDLIRPHVADIYGGLSSLREELETTYQPSASADDLAEALYSARKTDRFSGVTSVGPHRDDLDFKINGISARSFGSQGQKRSVALSLKLAEARTLKELTGEQPAAILDDVMSELDPERQNYILNHIEGWQVFITCCDPANTLPLRGGKIFSVNSGRVKEKTG